MSRQHRIGRRSIVLSAAAAAIVAAALAAATGTAQSTGATTLHLVSKSQKHVGFPAGRRPHQGDRFGFGDTITGDDTGFDRGVCTLLGSRAGLCTVEVHLSRGTLSVQGLLAEKDKNVPMAITGGTGAYDGARGTAIVNDTDASTTSIDVTLLP